ncbi:MAG: hypothetical protein P8M34_10770 [Saprospiraceae bacterium]|nr:hypothetical protein [Saprospiraceae bacterium]|tara:strand:+ start:803 stop:1318 length:516 start_codon:yes stop_codon:yes gene_type:complete
MKAYGKLIAGSVVFVIIGMPMLSYVYLRQGLSFRIDAIEALKQSKVDIDLTNVFVPEVDLVPEMVNAFVDMDDVPKAQMKEVYDKYQGNKYFSLSTYSEISENETWGEKHKLVLSNQVLEKVFMEHDLILVDTSGQVRESYSYSNESFKKFIQHLSVLLPVESSKKIKLER